MVKQLSRSIGWVSYIGMMLVSAVLFQNCSESMPEASGNPTASSGMGPQSGSSSSSPAPAAPVQASPAPAPASPDPLAGVVEGAPATPNYPTAPAPTDPVGATAPAPVVYDLSTVSGYLAANDKKTINIALPFKYIRPFFFGVRIALFADGYQVTIKNGLCSGSNCTETDALVFPKRTLAMINNGQDVMASSSYDRLGYVSSQLVQLNRDVVANRLFFSIVRPFCVTKTAYRIADLRTDGGDVFAGALTMFNPTILPPSLFTALNYQSAYSYDDGSVSTFPGACGEPQPYGS